MKKLLIILLLMCGAPIAQTPPPTLIRTNNGSTEYFDSTWHKISSSAFVAVNLNDYLDLQDCLEKNQGVASIAIYVPNGIHIQPRSLNNFDTKARSAYNFPNNIELIGESQDSSIIQTKVGTWTYATADITWSSDHIANDTIQVIDNTRFSVGDEIRISVVYNASGGYPIYGTISALVGTTKIVLKDVWNYSNSNETKTFVDSAIVSNLIPMIVNNYALTVKNLTIRGNPLDTLNTYPYMTNWTNYWQVIHGLDVATYTSYRLNMEDVTIKDFRFAEIQTWGSADINRCKFQNVGKGFHNSSVADNGHVTITNSTFININGNAAIYTCASGKYAAFTYDKNFFKNITINCISGLGVDGGIYEAESRTRITNNYGMNVGQSFVEAVPQYNHSFVIAFNTIENVSVGVRIRANDDFKWRNQLIWNSRWAVEGNVFTFKAYNSGITYIGSTYGAGVHYDRYGEYDFGASSLQNTTIDSTGIYADSTKNIIINGNILSGFKYGVDLLAVDRASVTNNIIGRQDSVTTAGYPTTFVEYHQPTVGVRLTNTKTTNVVYGLNNIDAISDSTWITR